MVNAWLFTIGFHVPGPFSTSPVFANSCPDFDFPT